MFTDGGVVSSGRRPGDRKNEEKGKKQVGAFPFWCIQEGPGTGKRERGGKEAAGEFKKRFAASPAPLPKKKARKRKGRRCLLHRKEGGKKTCARTIDCLGTFGSDLPI